MRFPRARRTGKDPAPGVTLQDSRKAYETARGFGVHLVGLGPGWRVEGQVAFATLFERYPELRLGVPDEEVRWGSGSFLRGFTRLPVLF